MTTNARKIRRQAEGLPVKDDVISSHKYWKEFWCLGVLYMSLVRCTTIFVLLRAVLFRL
jgi:hypothetical protein